MQSIFAEKPRVEEKLLLLSSQMDEFEAYDAGHAAGVAALAESLAAAFNLASRDRFFLEQAVLLHDIGEVTMRRDYIRSPSVLTRDERFDLERHPVIGEQETAKLGLPRGVQLIVRWHHEWWCGGGYPDGLVGIQIPLAARILRVADTFSALTAHRPFREAMPVDEAKKYMAEWAGIEFDPAIVKALVAEDTAEPVVPRGGTF